jgi:hypothetical protein
MRGSIIFVIMLMFLVPVHAENDTDNRTIGNLTDPINNSVNNITEFNITKGNDTIDSGITPDSVWYFLDVFFDDLRLALASSDEDKIKLELEIAEERLAEVNDMALKGDITGMIKAEKNHEKIFIKLQSELESRSEIEIGEEVQSRFENHNSEVERIKGELDIFIRTKGDLTPAQEAAIEALIASFEDKEGKIKIDIDNDTGRATIKVKIDKESEEDDSDDESCFGLDESSCVANDDCAPVYGDGTCIGNLTLLAECIAGEVFVKCVESSDDDSEDSDNDSDDDDSSGQGNSAQNSDSDDDEANDDSDDEENDDHPGNSNPPGNAYGHDNDDDEEENDDD